MSKATKTLVVGTLREDILFVFSKSPPYNVSNRINKFRCKVLFLINNYQFRLKPH
jgi:hypothetical protein